MKLIDLKATKETIDVKRQGLLIYETDQNFDGHGIILFDDAGLDHNFVVVNQVHKGGPVVVCLKPFSSYTKKFELGQVVAKLAVF